MRKCLNYLIQLIYPFYCCHSQIILSTSEYPTSLFLLSSRFDIFIHGRSQRYITSDRSQHHQPLHFCSPFFITNTSNTMCFGTKANPKIQTGVDDAPRTVHQYTNKPYSDGTSNSSKPAKTSGGFLADTPYGRSKAIQNQIKAGELAGAKRPT